MNEGTTAAVDTNITKGVAPTSQSNNHGGFLSRILPTAGSILGGIGGGIAGTVAAPFTGGIINPIDAGIAGASGGDVLGRIGENALTHQSLKNDLGASAASGAIGQAVGGLLGGITSKVLGKAISPLASKFTADAVMKQAPGLLDRPTAQYLIDNGMTNLSKVTKVAPKVVGQATGEVTDGPAFTNAIQDAVENNTDKININQALQQVSDVARKSVVKPTTQQNIGDALQSSIENMTQASGGDISKIPKFSASGKPLNQFMTVFGDSGQMKNMTRGAVYDEAKQFLSTASQIAAKAPKDQFGNLADPQQSALVDAFNAWGHGLESHALGLGDEDITFPVSPEAKQSMQAGIASLEQTNPKLFNTLSQNIEDANTYKDIKSATAPLVKASKAANAVSGNLNSVPSTTPLEAGAGGKANIIKAILGSPTAKKAEAFSLNKIANAASTGTPGNDASILLKSLGIKNQDASLINKVLPIATRSSLITAANLPEEVPQGGVQSNVGALGTGANAMNPTNTVLGQDPLNQLYQQLLQNYQADPNNASTSATLGTLNAIAPQIQKQAIAAPLLGEIPQEFANAGGPQGLIGGLLQKATGLISGTPANVYGQQSQAAAYQLASVLGISPAAAAQLLSLPQLTSTAQTAAPQEAGLNSVLRNITPSAVPAQ